MPRRDLQKATNIYARRLASSPSNPEADSSPQIQLTRQAKKRRRESHARLSRNMNYSRNCPVMRNNAAAVREKCFLINDELWGAITLLARPESRRSRGKKAPSAGGGAPRQCRTRPVRLCG